MAAADDATQAQTQTGMWPSRRGRVLLLALALALRPLCYVFSCAELLLLAVLLYAHDRWQASANASAQRGELTGGDHGHVRRRASAAASAWSAPRKSLEVPSIASSGHSEAQKEAQKDAAAPPAAPPAVELDNSSADAKAASRIHSGADSMGSSTTDASNASSASNMAARGYEDDSQSDELSRRRRGTSLLFSSSICMSRGAGESAQHLIFSSASGEMQLRRDTLFHVLRHWSDCSLQLSVLTGQLRVQRKSKPEPDVFPLVLYTGSSIHRKRGNVFKLVFYGHEPLHFRTAEARDAELWVKALEYAKESTWHLWA